MSNLEEQFVNAVEADNWAGVNLISAREGLEQKETVQHVFTAVAFLFAELREPKRAPIFTACLEVMRALNDPRHAQAVQHRFELTK